MIVPEAVMAEVVARLTAAPSFGMKTVKRSHRTVVARDYAPAIHVIPDVDVSQEGKSCTRTHKFTFAVRLLMRDDDATVTGPMLEEVLRRLGDRTTPYPNRARINYTRVKWDEETADADAIGADIECSASYESDDWSLNERAA